MACHLVFRSVTLSKHNDIQPNFKDGDIHRRTPSQSTHLFGIAVSHAWVYDLMCITLLTILRSKREMQTCLKMCWMVQMNMCTSWWHTSARCYTLLELGRFGTGAPTSTIINTSQWFSSLGAWRDLWSCVGKCKPCSKVFRSHIISKPSLHLMCMNVHCSLCPIVLLT